MIGPPLLALADDTTAEQAQRVARAEPGDTQRSSSVLASEARVPEACALAQARNPLASLIREHQVIGQLAEALLHFSVCVAAEPSSYDRADLAGFARVFHELVDCLHHEKEETILLPLLAQLGFDWENGPLADVRLEHGQERCLIDGLCQAAVREGDWDQEERRRIAASACAVAEFQRAHLRKENTQLFPVILQRMSPGELRLLEAELRLFDLRMARYWPRAELSALAQDLIRRYLPPVLAVSGAAPCGLSTLALAGA
jgi:hemerythrin-like domain-containing protein